MATSCNAPLSKTFSSLSYISICQKGIYTRKWDSDDHTAAKNLNLML